MMEFTNEDQSYKKKLLSKIDEDKLIEAFDANANEDELIDYARFEAVQKYDRLITSITSIRTELFLTVGDSKHIKVNDEVDILSTIHIFKKTFQINATNIIDEEFELLYEAPILISVINGEIDKYHLLGYCKHDPNC
jgi:hypothetical protein